MRYFTIFLLVLALAGCGKHCIAVDGSYQGIDGKIEYCFDSQTSLQEGLPVFYGEEGQLFGLTEDQVKAIVEKIKGKLGIASAMTHNSLIGELMALLKEGEANE